MKVSEECLDSFAKFETAAYIDGMKASYHMEKENWQEALDLLMNSKVIYSKICSFKDSLEAVIYQERISQLDTFIRLCCAGLTIKTSSTFEEKVAARIDPTIVKAHNDTKQEQIENIQEITFNGKNIPLKSERLRLVFKRVEIQLAQLNDPSKQNSDQISNYLNFVNILDDAQLVIRKEKAEESKKSEQTGQLYNVLLQYISRLKLKATIDRNLL